MVSQFLTLFLSRVMCGTCEHAYSTYRTIYDDHQFRTPYCHTQPHAGEASVSSQVAAESVGETSQETISSDSTRLVAKGMGIRKQKRHCGFALPLQLRQGSAHDFFVLQVQSLIHVNQSANPIVIYSSVKLPQLKPGLEYRL